MLGWSFKPVNLLASPPRDQRAIFCFSKQIEVSTISLYLIGPCWHSTSRVDIPYWPIMFLSLFRQTSFCRLIFFWLSVCFLFVGTITESKPSLDNFPPGVLIWPRLNYSIWSTVSADLVLYSLNSSNLFPGFEIVNIFTPSPEEQGHPTTRICNSSSSSFFCARHKKSGWRYLGNEKSYQRSAGIKMTGFSMPFQI